MEEDNNNIDKDKEKVMTATEADIDEEDSDDLKKTKGSAEDKEAIRDNGNNKDSVHIVNAQVQKTLTAQTAGEGKPGQMSVKGKPDSKELHHDKLKVGYPCIL